MAHENQGPSFKDTLNLPRTDFPIRANAKENDPQILKRWQDEDLYYKSFIKNAGHKPFILHDGPPYANGPIHIGHAYNKILKDIVTKSQRMSGKYTPVTPGWDCHGLPIELKVTQELPNLSREALLKECRLYAQKWITVQRDEFKKLGVLMNWDKPYLTMDYSYEAAILRAFGRFVDQGYIERKLKTVPWCPSDQTVLAMAEIEYKERKDPSIYVSFPLSKEAKQSLVPDLKNEDVSIAVWTTTPWTLPLNRAVLLKPKTPYDILKIDSKYVIVAQALVESLLSNMEKSKEVVGTLLSEDFAEINLEHPFVENLVVPIILDPHVSLEDGTAAVHCAPGCGPQDYDIALREGIEIFAPISADGKYTIGIEPQELVGMPVADGQIWVMKKLVENGRMLHKTSIRHNYPHCWRCHNGLIYRATSQWFCNLSHNNLKDKALAAIDQIDFYPERSVNFLKATTEGRLEWCLSRQRTWGVPIPAISCKSCNHVWTTVDIIERAARGVEKEGIEFWNHVSLDQLGVKGCPECPHNDLKKEYDILDVWFESGVSHYAVLYKNKELSYPADMYLEGVDQHRAWFQSSLLTSLILEHEACTKSFLTHGFVVDAKGHKMSKSLGNVVSPGEMIDKLGTDGLRLWASSLDNASDAIISEQLIENVGNVHRKIRNTCRFLLSNLYDFDHENDSVPLGELYYLDQAVLLELIELNETIRQAYDSFNFTGIFHALNEFSTVTLSQIYMDVVKDRLYTEAPKSLARRSAQTVIWYILDTMTKLMAPILSFTAEQVADFYQKDKKESIHLQDFNDLTPFIEFFKKKARHNSWAEKVMPTTRSHVLQDRLDAEAANALITMKHVWQFMLDLRSALLKVLEVQREQGVIKHPYEAQIILSFDLAEDKKHILNLLKDELAKTEQTLEQCIKELLVVSQVQVATTQNGLAETELKGVYALAKRADGVKCPRCWQWHTDMHKDNLCARCAAAI